MRILKPGAQQMRDVRALAKGSDVSAVNAYDFRSAEEVKVYLKELQQQVEDLKLPDSSVLGDAEAAVTALMTTAHVVLRRTPASNIRILAAPITLDRSEDPEELQRRLRQMKLDKGRDARNTRESQGLPILLDEKFTVANEKKLEQQFSVIKALHNKLEILDAMELTVKQLFAGEKQTLGSNVARVRKTVETKLKAALAFLSKAADKKEPKQFKAEVDPVVTTLLARAEGMYKKPATQKNYLFTKSNAEGKLFFVFQRQIVLQNFRSEDDAFSYPTYVIVFTAVVSSDQRMTMHVTTLHAERPPGTFKFGQTFTTAKSALQELDALMDMDKVVDLMTAVKLPKDKLPEGWTSVKQFIADTKMAGNIVTIQMNKKLPKGTEQRQTVFNRMLGELRNALGYGKAQTLKTKERVAPDGTVVYEFMLVPNSTGKHKAGFDDRQHRILKTHLGFDDDDIAQLIRVMQRGF